MSVPGGSQRSKHSAFQKALKDADVEYLDVPACTWPSFAERYLRSNKEVESNQTRKITDFIISSPNNATGATGEDQNAGTDGCDQL